MRIYDVQLLQQSDKNRVIDVRSRPKPSSPDNQEPTTFKKSGAFNEVDGDIR